MMSKQTNEQIYQSIVQLKYLVVGGVVLSVVFMGVVLYLDGNTESFEKSARYQPPPESVGVSNESDASEAAELPVHPVRGQTVYVPAYSHIYHRNGSPILLTITLSIRNTSLEDELIVESVRYFDTSGKEVKSYLKKPLRLGPLGSTEFLVEQDDESGGSGANFIVHWVSEKAVTNPIIEAVMIDTNRQQGISFARNGVVVGEIVPAEETAP